MKEEVITLKFIEVDGRASQEEIFEAHLPYSDVELFRLGLEELLFVNSDLGSIARSMGMPVWDDNQETAYVTYDGESKTIMFAFNPSFIRSITTEECAGVIAHETHHVVLEHLKDFTNPEYTDRDALVKAQECIINDTVVSVYELPLPPIGVCRGEEIVGQDCTHLPTRTVYDLLAQDNEAEGTSGEGDGNESSESTGSSGSGSPTPGCGGVRVDEADYDAIAAAAEALIEDAASSEGKTVEELVESLTNSSAGGYSPTGAPVSEASAISSERMNWRALLARINPKVLEAGKTVRPRNDWASYNRRMGAVYPKAILPKVKTEDPAPKEKGDAIPSMVIALDLSGSIDRSLVKMLQGLLTDIPEDLIQAYPCTWGSNLIPFTPGGRVAGGGTNIDLVSSYVRKIQAETGTEPYVLVITDGQFYSRFSRPGKDWFFMGVDNYSIPTIKRYHCSSSEEVYHVKDFRDRG